MALKVLGKRVGTSCGKAQALSNKGWAAGSSETPAKGKGGVSCFPYGISIYLVLFPPSQVWKLGWSPKPGGDFGTVFPEIPVEFLQEKEVLKEFIYRINTLGIYPTVLLSIMCHLGDLELQGRAFALGN